MEFTAFTRRLGIGQGRIQTEDGALFVLGDNELGRFAELAPGDFVEAVQLVDLTDVKIVRAPVRLRTPASMPANLAWEVSVVVDGVKHGRMCGWPGRERVLSDLGANVSKLTGVHEIGVRLELVLA